MEEILKLLVENKIAIGLVVILISKIINRFNKDIVSDDMLGKLNYYNSKLATFGGKPTKVVKK